MAEIDVEEKMTEFKGLGSKAKMRTFITELNKTIPQFKDQLRKSGNVDKLIANYREYIERIAQGGQGNKKPVPRAKAKQGATAGDIDEEGSQEIGESSQSRRKAKHGAADTDNDQLSTLMIAPEAFVSEITRQCLEALESSFDTQPKQPDDDNSAALQPLYNAIREILTARSLIPLSYNHGENHQRLNMAISHMDPVEVSVTILKPIMTAIGIECSGPEVGDDSDTAATAAIAEEIDIIWNEYSAALVRWSDTFPEPPANEIIWPLNFTEKEAAAVRQFAREFIKGKPHLANKTIDPEDLRKALDYLRQNWPISKGKMNSIAQLVLDDARREYTRSQSRSRSRQPKGKSIGGDDDNVDEDDDNDDEGGQEDAPKRKGKGKGKGKAKAVEKEKHSKRKRPVALDSDDSDVGSSWTKADRTERGGSDRGRSLRRRSPAKRGR